MRIVILVLVVLIVGCSPTDIQTNVKGQPESNIFTFYRNSILDSSMRIHVATFDSKEGGK